MSLSLQATLYNMRDRCNNPNNPAYKHYGGRGIKCLITSTKELYNILGSKPTKEHTVDRIDMNGHYEATNIRWATKIEQAANSNRNPLGGVFWNKRRTKWIAAYKHKHLFSSNSFGDCLAMRILEMEKQSCHY